MLTRFITAFRVGYSNALKAWIANTPMSEEQIVQLEVEMEAAGEAKFQADLAASLTPPAS